MPEPRRPGNLLVEVQAALIARIEHILAEAVTELLPLDAERRTSGKCPARSGRGRHR